MTTRDSIIILADNLIRAKGYNAFSFNDLAREIGIKTASIHYHFPTKSDLGVAIIKEHVSRFEKLRKELQDKDPIKKLEGFFSIYTKIQSEDKVCLVGSLATDLHTVDVTVQKELKAMATMILEWVTEILKEGKTKKVFYFKESPRTKALMIITNMLAIVQLCRLTSAADFSTVKETILKELKSTTK